MSNDLNQCNFIGRLGQDVETRQMPSGEAVANISLAVGESWKDKQSEQKQERTEWVRVVAFGKLAEIMAQYLSKGSMIFISGKMRTRKWQDNSGQDRYSTEIVVNNMKMLDSLPQGGKQQNPQQQGHAQNQQQQAPHRQHPNGGYPQNQRQPPAQPQGGLDDFDDWIPF